MLLGRPLFCIACLKQDWATNEVTFRKDRKEVVCSMKIADKVDKFVKPLYAQSINVAADVTDAEEDLFFQSNPTIVPVFEVDIAAIMDRYWMTGTMTSPCFQMAFDFPSSVLLFLHPRKFAFCGGFFCSI